LQRVARWWRAAIARLPGRAEHVAHFYLPLIPGIPSILETDCGRGELLTESSSQGSTRIGRLKFQVDQVNSRLPQSDFLIRAGEQLTLKAAFDAVIISGTLDEAVDV